MDQLTIRLATPADQPLLRRLMKQAISDLLPAFLNTEQISASHEVMGLDSQVITDGTYYVVEIDGRIAGCGGWSRRATLFGGDHSAGRDAALLNPDLDAARVRAMYTNPDFVRRGVARAILAACEAAARDEGFTRAEMAATLAGEPLYAACGYVVTEAFEVEASTGVRVPLKRMGKPL